MATSSVLSTSERYVSKGETILVDIFCERCMKRLQIPTDSNKKLLPQQTGSSCENPLGKYDILFIDNFQMVTACNRRHDLLRPLLSKSSDLGKLNTEVLDMMGDSPKVDYPMCEDCTDNILDHMNQELKADENDIDEYRQLLIRLEMEEEEEDVDELRAELQNLQEIEARLQEEWSQLETEGKEIKNQIRHLENDCDTLERKTNEYFQKENRIDGQYLQLEDSFHSIKNQRTYVKSKLDKLNETDVFRLGFKILCDSNIATINGYRLGRLPNIPVAWTEISAAWGQAVLLLHSLSKLINFTLEDYELVPMSNRSYVKLVQGNDVKLLPLFYSGEGNNKTEHIEFDVAMVGFLNYLQKFNERIEGETLRLPYSIQRSRIIDGRTGNAYTVRRQLNTEENWTRALKFVLTDLRWALAWSSKIVVE